MGHKKVTGSRATTKAGKAFNSKATGRNARSSALSQNRSQRRGAR